MAKRNHRSSNISPINPSLHFLLFLVMALILIVVVANVMTEVSKNTRAAIVCPQNNQDQVAVIENLSRNCKYGVSYTTDGNNCKTWVCKPAPIASPKVTKKLVK